MKLDSENIEKAVFIFTNTLLLVLFVLLIYLISLILRNINTFENFNTANNFISNKNKYCNKNMRCFYIDKDVKDNFNEIKNTLNIYYNNLLNVMDDKVKKDRLKNKFKIDNLFEVFPLNLQNDTSYTINKGEELGLCIRSGEDFYKIHDMEVILFVFTHELAHVITLTEQHTEEFWKNFKYLLHLAYKNNLLSVINFENNPHDYCGIKVDYNPYLDNNLIM